MADIAVRNPDEAMDIVQDAMLTLATKYAAKPAAQWPPLFYRILQNRIRDFHRRGKVRNRIFGQWFSRSKGIDEEAFELDPIEQTGGPVALEPHRAQELETVADDLDAALGALPDRQREAFMLRVWEGMDVAQTAQAMGCSQGSVKTHYSRAVHALRDKLETHWYE